MFHRTKWKPAGWSSGRPKAAGTTLATGTTLIQKKKLINKI